MSLKKSNKKKMKAFFARSKILTFFIWLAAFLYSKAEESIIGRLFTSYDENAKKSYIFGLFDRLNLGKRFFRPLKRTVSRLVSQSFLLQKIHGYLQGWLYTKLNVYGLFSITSGIGFLLIHLLKVYGLNISEISFLDVFTSVMFILISIPLMFSSSTLNSAVCNSRTASSVVFGAFGCKKNVFEQQSLKNSHSKTALPAGIIFCVLSWWIRPVILLAVIIVFVFAVMVFYIPETGIVVLVFVLPFMQPERLSLFIIYITLCFLFKYIRGKRTVKFDPLSWAVLAFALIALPGGVFGEGAVWCICAYFLVVNLIKSKKWIGRCVGAAAISFFVVVSYGLARYISSASGADYLLHVFRCFEKENMISAFGYSSVFCSYIVMMFPIAVIKRGGKGNGLLSFISIIMGGACLLLAHEYRVWISLIIGTAFFLVFYSRKALASVGIMLCTLPFVFVNLPKTVFEEMSYNRITGYLTESGRVAYLKSAPLFAMVLFLMFVLVIFLCLQKNITLYSRGCSRQGRTVSLAAMTGIISYFMFGANNSDYRIVLLFWLMLGFASCVSGSERNSFVGGYMNEYGYSEEEEL